MGKSEHPLDRESNDQSIAIQVENQFKSIENAESSTTLCHKQKVFCSTIVNGFDSTSQTGVERSNFSLLVAEAIKD